MFGILGVFSQKRFILGNPEQDYSDFSDNIFPVESKRDYYSSNGWLHLSWNPFNRSCFETMCVNYLRFFDDDCKIVDGKFNQHLLENLKYFNVVIVDITLFDIKELRDFVNTLNYLSEFPNVIPTGPCKYNYEDYHINTLARFLEVLDRKTTDSYSNQFTGQESGFYQTEYKRLIGENEELQKKIKTLEGRQKIICAAIASV